MLHREVDLVYRETPCQQIKSTIVKNYIASIEQI